MIVPSVDLLHAVIVQISGDVSLALTKLKSSLGSGATTRTTAKMPLYTHVLARDNSYIERPSYGLQAVLQLHGYRRHKLACDPVCWRCVSGKRTVKARGPLL